MSDAPTTTELAQDVQRGTHCVQRFVVPVAVLYCRPDSVYKSLPGCDCWDEQRDARGWTGGMPVVVHPPCGHWGRLRKLCTKPDAEKSLAPSAVECVRRWGGVLEHPAGSKLWNHCGLPKPGLGPDKYGGWTFSAPQWWWGHPANKATWLYIVGITPEQLPPIPFRIGQPLYTVATDGRSRATMRLRGLIGEMKKSERDATPIDFAQWLVELARRTKRNGRDEKAHVPQPKAGFERTGDE